MATKSKVRKKSKGKKGRPESQEKKSRAGAPRSKAPMETEETASETAEETETTKAKEPERPSDTVRKAIYLSALIYVEGDQPAPEDFAAVATSAVKEELSAAFKDGHNGLTMTLKKVEVRNDIEENGEEEEEKFQF
jgi:hypothetical protein